VTKWSREGIGEKEIEKVIGCRVKRGVVSVRKQAENGRILREVKK